MAGSHTPGPGFSEPFLDFTDISPFLNNDILVFNNINACPICFVQQYKLNCFKTTISI
jgi:hypothetical protein